MCCFSISKRGKGIACRRLIVMLTFLVICSGGVAALWFLVEPVYTVTGAIRVAPIISNILTGEDDRGGISYDSFMNTQAQMVTGSRVVQRVADDLADKGLTFLEGRTSGLIAKLRGSLNLKKVKLAPADVLKQAILDKVITAAPVRRAELIAVSMKWTDAEEAKRIVDAFIRHYMAVEVTSAEEQERQGLGILESEQRILSAKVDNYRAQISELAKEFGSKKLDSRYDMNLQRVASLLKTLTEVEARRIYLQAQVKLLEQTQGETVPLQESVLIREEYVNKDPEVQVLTTNILTLDQELIALGQTEDPAGPEIKQKKEVLKALRTRLDEQKKKARDTFRELMKEEAASQSNKKLADLKATLEQTRAHETELRNLLSKEDTQTIDLGQKNLAIQGLEDKLAFTKEMYDRISRRIVELKMERKRASRITVAYNADVERVRDARGKYTIVLILVSAALGILLVLVRKTKPQG